jgi:hypothetical protein
MKNFKIKEKYLKDVRYSEIKKLSFIHPITGEHLVDKEMEVQGVKDHPQFTRLRKYLSKNGYIHMELSWWNGDRALKPFKVNGYEFKEHETFYCASALGTAIKCKRR